MQLGNETLRIYLPPCTHDHVGIRLEDSRCQVGIVSFSCSLPILDTGILAWELSAVWHEVHVCCINASITSTVRIRRISDCDR